MSDLGKTLRDLAGGSFADARSTSTIGRALEAQRSIDKLTAVGLFGENKIGRLALGLPTSEMARAMEIAGGKLGGIAALSKHMSFLDQAKISGLILHDPFEKYGAMHKAVEEAIGKTNRFEMTAFGRAHEAAAKLTALHEHRFGNGIDKRIEESVRKLTETNRASLQNKRRCSVLVPKRLVPFCERDIGLRNCSGSVDKIMLNCSAPATAMLGSLRR